MTKMDCHVHSDFSPDSKAPMEEMIKSAIETNITDLAFTDHIDLDYDVSVPDGDWIFNQDDYFETIDALKERFKFFDTGFGKI